MTAIVTEINSWDDLPSMQAAFAQTGRIQIRNFLPEGTARAIQTALKALEWRLVLNENGKHLDIHPVQIKQLGPKKMRLIKQAAQARATHEFQYLYENYPVFDILKSGKPVNPIIDAIYKALNSQAFRSRLTEMTGLPVDYCDIQATRYRKGHFLTTHDDGVEGKNRQMAFVLNLTEVWRASWGGRLEFTGPHGEVIDTLLPLFNSLSLFKVPQPHEVTRVSHKAKHPRMALTGWFRTR